MDKYLKWFQVHERLLIVLSVLIIGVYGFNKWLDKSAVDAHSKDAVIAQQLAEVKQQNQQLAATVAQQTEALAKEHEANAQEIAVLVQAMASRDAASRQKVEHVLAPTTPPQAVKDLSTAYNGTIAGTVNPDSSVSFPVVAVQQFTATKIEHDTLETDVEADKQLITMYAKERDDAFTVIDSQKQQVAGLNLQITKGDEKCKADIKVIKADARKSKRNWFIGGFVTGFFARSAIKVYTGI